MTQRVLFIHQNFPGQFVHLARALAAQGHDVIAMGIHTRPVEGVRGLSYHVAVPPRRSEVPLVADLEVKVVRGASCAAAMRRLKDEGFDPDLIVAHPGWGEALFCKDVWPDAKLLVFSEFFYTAQGADCNFDPEFPRTQASADFSLRMKNTALLHGLSACDAAYAPTQWQRSRVPAEYQDKVEVIFDGINTEVVRPDPDATFQVPGTQLIFKAGDEVLTFVNRNLEPYRGFHIFMRALPRILAERPNAHCLIVGGDKVSYGKSPSQGGSWKEVMLKEVGARLPLDRVHFLGQLPYAQYLKVLQVSRCHVYLTYPFVLSWSCVEAMSAGCTIVASDTAPVQEFLVDGQTALLCNFFDAEAVADRTVKVLARPRPHAHLGERARQVAVERYDLRRTSLPAQLELVSRLMASEPLEH